MEKINLPRRFRVYVPLIALFVFLVFMMPKSPKFSYDYKKGSPWMHETLIAQFDFPVLKTEQQLQQEREQASLNVIPYYRKDARVAARAERQLASIDFGSQVEAKNKLPQTLDFIYSKGVLSPASEHNVNRDANPEGVMYVQKDRRAAKVSVAEVFIVAQAENLMRDAYESPVDSWNVDSL